MLVTGLDAVAVGLRVLQGRQRRRHGFLDFPGRAVAHEHRLALPLDDDLLALLDLAHVELDRRQRQGVGGGVHRIDQRPGQHGSGADGGRAGRDMDEVPAGGVAALTVLSHDRFGHVLLLVRRDPRPKGGAAGNGMDALAASLRSDPARRCGSSPQTAPLH